MISDTTKEDKNNILILEYIMKINHIANRGFPLSKQVSQQNLPSNYSDSSSKIINLSQDTIDILHNDENFIENLQKEKIKRTLSGTMTSDTSESEVTLKIREIINVTKHNTELKKIMSDIDE